MLRVFKYVLLGLGAFLIIASFITKPPVAEQSGMDLRPPSGKDFIAGGRDEFIKPVEDYTRESPSQETMSGAPKQESDAVCVTITKGARGSDVAALLVESGLIKDKGEFEKQLIDLKLDRRIIYGDYIFKKDEELMSIIERITTAVR